jgi:hypothetical protein
MEEIYKHGQRIQHGIVTPPKRSVAMQTLEVTPDEFQKMQDILGGPVDEWKQAEAVAAIVGVPVERLAYRKTDVVVVHEVKTRLKLNA